MSPTDVGDGRDAGDRRTARRRPRSPFVTRRQVPRRERDQAEGDEPAADEARLLDPPAGACRSDAATITPPIACIAADQAHGAAVRAEHVEHEHDEQHDEDALRDLARGPDRRGGRRRGVRRSCAGRRASRRRGWRRPGRWAGSGWGSLVSLPALASLRAGTRIAASSSADTTNVAASTATTPASPSSWTASPPSGDPTSRARLAHAFSAFAERSSSRGTRLGMSAACRGAGDPGEARLSAATR